MRTICTLGAGFLSGMMYVQSHSEQPKEIQALRLQIKQLKIQNQVLQCEVEYTDNCKYYNNYLRNAINHPIWETR